MEKRIDRMETKIDTIIDTLTGMSQQVAVNTEELKEHKRRSIANERNNELLREYIDTYRTEIDRRFKPHDIFIDRIKFLGIMLAILAPTIVGLHELGFFSFVLKVNQLK